MVRRAQVFASAVLALACARCSLLLYNDDELTGAPTSSGADSGGADASGDATRPPSGDASPDAPDAPDAGGDARFPTTATVWPTNGHAYEVVVMKGLNWNGAKLAAEARGGHLVTITSDKENDFVYALADPIDDAWKQVQVGEILGPWIGCIQAPGSVEPAAGFGWVTNEPFTYTAFATGQPDDSGGEGACHFYGGSRHGRTWNDFYATTGLDGYVVEYE